MLASALIAATVSVASGPVVMLGIPLGWVAAIFTLAAWLACLKVYRNPEARARSDTRISRAQICLGSVASAIAIIGCVDLAQVTLSRAREVAKAPVSASNLRGIGMGLKLYSADHNDYPPSFEELVTSGHLTWGQFWAMGDPEVPHDIPEEQARYSSFVYQPGAGTWRPDAEVILAYERGAWTPLALRVFLRYGRYVLFGDGRVTLLDDEAFNVARQRDVQKRAELGWPPPANE